MLIKEWYGAYQANKVYIVCNNKDYVMINKNLLLLSSVSGIKNSKTVVLLISMHSGKCLVLLKSCIALIISQI